MNCLLQENIDITHLSNYKTPAKARFFYAIKDESSLTKLHEVYSFAQENALPVLTISAWTNMLFAFDLYQWVVIHNEMKWWSFDTTTKILKTYWSEGIWNIADELEKKYQEDIWHRFIWLPWSIAGAIYGNAGCFWLETSCNFVSCDVYNMSTWKISTLLKHDMNFWYRYSTLKDNKYLYIISATFDLSKIVEKYSSNIDNIYFREHLQPKWNSCWSFFKNPKVDRDVFLKNNPHLLDICPKNISAWFLLEQTGFKWLHYGGAFFSKLHTNFLMHNGQWKWTDLLYLIELAEQKVYKEFWIRLENEVQIIRS